MIYFIHAPESDAIKIGVTNNPWRRFEMLQTGCPTKLELLAVEDGGREYEARLHSRFSQHHKRGEWFHNAPAIKAHIATLPPIDTRPNARKPLGGKLGQWLTANRVSPYDFAPQVGSTFVSIYRFCQGKHVPPRGVMRRIYEVTGGQVQPNDFYDLPTLAADLEEAA